MTEPKFIFVTCQVGAEAALKAEVARRYPEIRFAFSRPGFLTFKLPVDGDAPRDLRLDLTFGRAHGLSLGKVKAETLEQRVAGALNAAREQRYDAVHVWQRDWAPAGQRGYQPGPTKYSQEAAEQMVLMLSAGTEMDRADRPPLAATTASCSAAELVATSRPQSTLPINATTRLGQSVFDIVIVDPDEWWLGTHTADNVASCWPGGFCPITLPEDAVSRAWLKLEEALHWSGLPLKAGQTAAEVGCAPGGSCQALLARGLHVIGIDPAEVDPVVAAHPNFVQIRRRGHEVRRRDFRKVRWLTADMNVAPEYTLDTVEAIVTHAEVDVRGMLLTLKLLDWNLAEQIPMYLQRIRAWGYPQINARQLQHNRQEICVAASRRVR